MGKATLSMENLEPISKVPVYKIITTKATKGDTEKEYEVGQDKLRRCTFDEQKAFFQKSKELGRMKEQNQKVRKRIVERRPSVIKILDQEYNSTPLPHKFKLDGNGNAFN